MSSRYLKKTFLVVGFIMIVLISIQLVNKIVMNYKINKAINTLKQDIKKLEGDKEKLISLKEYLSDKDYAEREARLTLGLQKEGEHTVIIPNIDQLKDKVRIIEKQLNEPEIKSNPQKWFNYFRLGY